MSATSTSVTIAWNAAAGLFVAIFSVSHDMLTQCRLVIFHYIQPGAVTGYVIFRDGIQVGVTINN